MWLETEETWLKASTNPNIIFLVEVTRLLSVRKEELSMHKTFNIKDQ